MAGKPNLLPKEHGAYAELAFPLVTGLALSRPSLPALALAAAAVAFFLANEPAAVLLGVRRMRLKDQVGERARRRAATLVSGGILLGVTGILSAGSTVWPVILLPLGSGILLIPMVLAGRHKSVPGELLVVSAFTTLLLPLASASGANPGRAVAAVGVWWVSFTLGTLEVHAIKARLKKTGRSDWTRWGSPLASGVVILGALGVAFGAFGPWPGAGLQGNGPVAPLPGVGGAWAWAVAATPYLPNAARAVLPPTMAILALSVIRVHPKRLKRVGWTLVGANSLALLLLLLG